MNPRHPHRSTLLVAAMILAAVSAMADDVYWNDASGGNFSDDTKWDTGVAPGSGDNAFITLDGDYTVVVDVNTEVQGLILGASTGTQTLSLSSRILTLTGPSSVGTNGIVILTSSTISQDAGLSNGGRIDVRGSSDLSGSGTFSNDASGTIRIEGRSGGGHANFNVANGFTNPGTIELGTIDTGYLSRLTVSSGTLVNTGLIDIQSGSGGSRQLYTALDNQGTVDFGAATTFNPPGIGSNANSGDININSGDVSFSLGSHSFSSSGTINITGGNLSVSSGSGFTNTGDITIGSGRELSLSNLTFNQDAGTLGGQGTLELTSTTANFTTDFSNASTTVLISSSTINGPGTLTNATSLTLTDSTVAAPFTNNGDLFIYDDCDIDSGPGEFTSSASSTIRIEGRSGGGHATLTVANGFTNPGTIELGSIDTGYLSRLTVSSGTLVNTGLIDIQPGAGGSRDLFTALDNQGTVDFGAATNFNPPGSGSNTNNGDMNINSGDVTFSLSSHSFSSSGTISISDGTELYLNGGTFTNFSGGTLTGGTYDVAGTFKFTGAALTSLAADLTLDGAGALVVNQSNVDAMPGLASITGDGVVEITNGHDLALTGALANAGELVIGDGSTLTVNGNLTQTAGGTHLDNGTLDISSLFDLQAGSLTGSGTVDGDLESAGTVAPGSSAGHLMVTGSHTQTPTHLLEIELAGTDPSDYDRFDMTGTSAIDGELSVSLLAPFAPPPGSTFDILTALSVSGNFSTANLPLVYPGGCLEGLFPGDRVRLNALAAAAIVTPPQDQTTCPGDPATFTVTAGGGGTLTYQWRKDGIDIPGANTSSHTIPSVTGADEGFYDVVVGNLCGAITSAPAELVLGEAPVITTDPAGQTAFEGQPVKFTVEADSGTTPTYQWRKDGADLPGETDSSLVLTAVTPADDGDYDVVVTNDCDSITSAIATLVVVDPPVVSTGRSFCSEPDRGFGRPELPPELCEYLSPSPADIFIISEGLPAGATIEAVPVLEDMTCLASPCGSPGGTLGGEIELFNANLRLHMTGTGSLAGFSRVVVIPVTAETHSGPRTPGGNFQSFAVELYTLEGALTDDPDFDSLIIRSGTGLGLPGPGTVSIFARPGASFGIEQLFDIAYEIEFVGAGGSTLSGFADTTSGTAKLALDKPPGILDPCVVTDIGGTAELPPEGCVYHSASEPIVITDGLPPGSTVLLTPQLRDFVCQTTPCGQPGGSLGGDVELFDSVLELAVRGTGSLTGFERTLVLSASAETHSAPQTPGDPVQHFVTATESLDATLSGDLDFDSLVISIGAANGLPSPGLSTLTDRLDGSFDVDSFFDLSYEIGFVGAPGGALDGMSGSVSGRVGLTATVPGLFADGFESGDTGEWD